MIDFNAVVSNFTKIFLVGAKLIRVDRHDEANR
jgi:hypothetical protein